MQDFEHEYWLNVCKDAGGVDGAEMRLCDAIDALVREKGDGYAVRDDYCYTIHVREAAPGIPLAITQVDLTDQAQEYADERNDEAADDARHWQHERSAYYSQQL